MLNYVSNITFFWKIINFERMRNCMQTAVTNTQKEELKHSNLGITSFVLTMFADFFMIFAALSSIGKGETGIGFYGIMFWLLVILSTILAIVDLNKPKRKKTLPKLSLIFGIGLFGAIFLLVLGTALLLK